MKKYKLLKNMPFAKAGEELYLKFSEDSEFFLVYKGTDKAYTAELNPEFIDNFDEWFEEVEALKVPDEFYIVAVYADKNGIIAHKISKEDPMCGSVHESLFLNHSSIGIAFETKEEAEKYIKYLKAKAIIKQDTKGFKPDWSDDEQPKHYGYCHAESKRLWRDVEYTEKRSTIYFRSIKDIEESLENHPEEWKTYLTYEQ